MPKIAFFVQLNKIRENIEGADLNIGNPGVGGTQYLFLLTVKVINSLYGKDYSILLTDAIIEHPDPGLNTDYAENEGEAVKYCERNCINNLVLNANVTDRVDPKIFDTSVEIMLWAHNTLTAKRQLIAAKTKSIKWIVCVSESQYLNMFDTPCYGKCTFINNMIPAYFYEHATISDHSEEKVVYVGSLMPQKGAHNLIDIWKFVEDRLPNAQLYIFGGANVWNTSVELGSSGADMYYDRIIQKRLKRLKHPENIHFMGAKGWGFIDSYISSFRLGVVNPSYYMRDETFCLSAIEMASHGLPIVSRQRTDGLGTTIIQGKTGYLESNNKSIARRIIEIVSDPNTSRLLGENGRVFAKQFISDNIVEKWQILALTSGNSDPRFKPAFLSKDSLMLKKDFALKIGYLIESGKSVDLAKKKLKLGG